MDRGFHKFSFETTFVEREHIFSQKVEFKKKSVLKEYIFLNVVIF